MAALNALSLPAFAQIQVLDRQTATNILDQLHEIDFEDLPTGGFDAEPVLPDPLKLRGITFTNPRYLAAAFCSSPPCAADPDNPDGGNIVLFLTSTATISLKHAPKLVVLDVYGYPYELLVTDKRGHTLSVTYDQGLLGLFSADGISKIEVQVADRVTGGPLALARILYSKHVN